MKKGELVLGPFQGRIACIRIKVGKGVCGSSVEWRRSVVVPDVHKFPGHIACDSTSNSEIVIPIIVNSNVIGVLDLDSPLLNGYDEEDQKGLEAIVSYLSSHLKWDSL